MASESDNTLDSTLESLEQFPLEESLEPYLLDTSQVAPDDDDLHGGLCIHITSGTTAGVSAPSAVSRGSGEEGVARDSTVASAGTASGVGSSGSGVGKDVPDKDKSGYQKKGNIICCSFRSLCL